MIGFLIIALGSAVTVGLGFAADQPLLVVVGLILLIVSCVLAVGERESQ